MSFGEYELPPMPPLGALAVRSVLGNGISSYIDIRPDFSKHYISLQLAEGPNLMIDYVVSSGNSIRIEDALNIGVLDSGMLTGEGSFEVKDAYKFSGVYISLLEDQ